MNASRDDEYDALIDDLRWTSPDAHHYDVLPTDEGRVGGVVDSGLEDKVGDNSRVLDSLTDPPSLPHPPHCPALHSLAH